MLSRALGMWAALASPFFAMLFLARWAQLSMRAVATICLCALVVWIWGMASLLQRFRHPVQTLANVLAALREGDYSTRPRVTREVDEPISLLFHEIDALAALLQARHIEAAEATALVRKIVNEVDVAIVLFDDRRAISFVNAAAERLLHVSAAALRGSSSDEVGLAHWFTAEEDSIVHVGGAPFQLRRSRFRQDGAPHTLAALVDVQRALRREQLGAWRGMIRVVGHEINNSLTPIASIARQFESALQSPRPPMNELREALAVIARRADSLVRFMSPYMELAKLPPPQLTRVEVGRLVERLVRLEQRLTIHVNGSPDAHVSADPDQLERAIANLLRNAVDAALETGGDVRISWTSEGDTVRLTIEDDGPGLGNSENLFVPFYTTKPKGSGIGLVLSRQIIENHSGRLSLVTRNHGSGATATIELRRA